MKKFLLGILFLTAYSLHAQYFSEKWSMHAALGHYPASIANPAVLPFRPGLHIGLGIRWNKHPKHQFVQAFQLGYISHKYIQRAIQLYSAFGYQLSLKNGDELKTPYAWRGICTLICQSKQFEME